MWPFKKEQKPHVTFTTNEWAIRKYAPIVPAKDFMPPAFKNMSTYVAKRKHPIDSEKTVKTCAGIVDYCSAGFVIPAWCDIEILPTPDGKSVNVRYSQPKFKHALHPQPQLQDFMNTRFSVRVGVKLDNPWTMHTAEDYSLLCLPMYYYDDTRNWEAIPGWLDQDVGAMVSPINIMLNRIEPTYIKMGEPIMQVIPIKREEVVAYTGAYDAKIDSRLRSLAYLWGITFAGWMKYMRTKKSYTVDAHDTELED